MAIKNGVSITLCTFNGKHLLPQTLEHLAKQKLTMPCELILVDNASTDGTKAFADNWWDTHGNDNIAYRSLSQPIPGKSYAQDLAYEHANYECLLICDDDNWLDADYVQRAYDTMQTHPDIGAIGGCSEAVFEKEAPRWFDTYANFYAVGKQSPTSGDITEKEGYLYGAGMMVRKSHWLELKTLGFEHLLSCRKGNALSSGGDTEYCYALRLLGYRIWYDDQLKFKHFMASGRLNLSYLSRLRKAMAYSNFVIHTYRLVLQGKSPSKWKTMQQKLKKQFLKKMYKLGFGNYREKEAAKAYFRDFKLVLFSHQERRQHYQFIRSWVPTEKLQESHF
ncbi:MAG: glycosyltransferase family 2 protein [Algicola sp.]|nr:glycosyltransferase family 2 protein [Algicola sp.]